MRLKKCFSWLFLAVGLGVLLIGFNNCAPQSATNTESFQGQSDVLVSQTEDGDHHVSIYAPVSQLPDARSKLYYNNSTDPANAPRWNQGAINWYYNSSGVPSSLASTALATIQQSMGYWSSFCNIKFNYMGETTKGSEGGARDATNVIGWGGAAGATGVTYVSIRGNSSPLPISEADINLNIGDIRDATTLRAVVNHELGHMLGLKHSNISESIMFANPYHDIQYLLTLRADDISGCVGLYGQAGSGVAEVPAETAPPVVETPPVKETPTVAETPTVVQPPAVAETPTSTVVSAPPQKQPKTRKHRRYWRSYGG